MASPNPTPIAAATAWRWTLRLALLLYCLWAGLLILQRPGLQYDEALLVLGSVHMRHSARELTLPHDPNTWVCPLGRCFPLMTVRYVGAIKEYLCLPLFAAFGTRAEVSRTLSALLGLVGIWGLAKLLREQLGIRVAAVAALLVAMHPAYVDLTVFDNGTVSVWMGAMGLTAVMAACYLRRPGPVTAGMAGAAMGLGLWARANFAWLLAAFLLAALIAIGRRGLPRVSHWLAAAGGAIAGAAPLLAYQVVSGGGTWQAVGMFSTGEPMTKLLAGRLRMFAHAMLSDSEHRAMWGGPPLPDWQLWLFPLLVLLACVVCLLTRSAWPRVFAIAFLALAAFLFFSRMPVAEHHMIILVPVAAVLSSLASLRLGRAGAGVLTLYIACAGYWQIAAVRGLGRSGGVGQWSDGVFTLAKHLDEKFPGREIKILDWGLQNNLYVLTDGRMQSREVLDGESNARDGVDQRWVRQIEQGGVFLLNGPANRQIPASTTAFLRALAVTRPVVRHLSFQQRSGIPFAELFEIEPGTAHPASAEEPLSTEMLEGFHPPEAGGWRWTKREFVLGVRGPARHEPVRVRLVLDLYVPDASIQRMGAMTLTAAAGDRSLGSETYRQAGSSTFTRLIEWDLLKSSSRIRFALDKFLPPGAKDNRELGIVVTRVVVDEN